MTNKAIKTRKVKSNAKGRVPLTAQTINQREYFKSIRENQITVCRGLAGTGKTLIAIGVALELYESGEFDRIVVVRPAIEACGEKIGFLPGGLGDKMRPLVAPVYDNIRVLIRDEGYIDSLEREVIEVIPMAFLRGRTMNNCVVILDEAQNTSPAQMKLFLTRIGNNCKVIINGDSTQSDVSFKNGLDDIMEKGIGRLEGIGQVDLGYTDIVRSPIVAKVLKMYGE